MGSPVSPIVANLYMEYLEQKALSTAPPPRFCCKSVDNTFVIHKEINKQGFLQHINSVDSAIKLTVEDNKEDGSIPFLDTIVKPEAVGSLSTTVYRKPTHTDQYLQWDSHHNLSATFSVSNTLSHRAKTVCSSPELLQQEMEHLRKALTKCKYPKWHWTRWRKDLTGLPVRRLMGLTTKIPQVPMLSPMKLKPRVALLYLIKKVFVKASKSSVVDMTFKPTSKVAAPSRTSWSPPRTKTLWSTKVVLYTGTNVVT